MMINNGQPRPVNAIPFAPHFETPDAPACTLASEALRELLAAYSYSVQAERDVWYFAVTLQELRASGPSDSDLRWLAYEHLVLHACEVTRLDDESRRFQPTHPLVFTAKNCFVLTERGCDFARSVLEQKHQPGAGVAWPLNGESGSKSNSTTGTEARPARPRWESDRHELWIDDVLVKQFKWPAMNQEMVLATFQEENWPFRIDDPLPPQPDQDSKRRLSDTIKCLNRKQKTSLIHFRGDGTGEGVIWEVC